MFVSNLPRLGLSAVLALLPSLSLASDLDGGKWRSSEVTLHTNLNHDVFPGVDWHYQMVKAADAWNSGVDGIQLNIENGDYQPCAGVSYFDIPGDGNKNVAVFADTWCGLSFDYFTLAVTLNFYEGDYYTERDIIFNSNKQWEVNGAANNQPRYDFYRVAVHEIGHFLGLDHEEDEEIATVMYPYYGAQRNPSADDLQGLNILYSDEQAIRLNLEEPIADRLYTGIGNIRGWAVARDRIKKIELFIDDKFISRIPFGGARGDVGNAFPQYPRAQSAGFSMAYNWGLLRPGRHQVRVKVTDDNGNESSTSTEIVSGLMSTAFVDSAERVEITGPISVRGKNEIILQQVEVDGRRYQVDLGWDKGTQKWDIIDIRER
ncbi:MAG: matrixin family metalloprotease, partial [Cellvibrionaceae bacterium]|nr:matrixin family metalloprotease [Cellvibrionaceae bacterium]